GFFGVDEKPNEGKTYQGLVVRSHNTWVGVGQKLEGMLMKDSTYTFSLYLNRSNQYRSPVSGGGGEPVSFSNPTILKIWGYNSETNTDELLAESIPPGHSEWVKYEFVFTPKNGSYNEIDLMAYYAKGFEQTNGNLLIDHCSDIVKIKK
ncbi:MAG TPA: OmpA family protein, partial [Saprospirales bacterium]|nr:OmpA family protein [Saprospirales bacterium]